MFVVTIFSVATYLKSVDEYHDFIEKRLGQLNLVLDMEAELKEQVKEWKNILLKGKDPEQRVIYKKRFDEHEQFVKKLAGELEHGPFRFLSGGNKERLAKFEEVNKKLNDDYEKSFKSFAAAGGANVAEIDAQTTGADEAALTLIDESSAGAIANTQKLIVEQDAKARQFGAVLTVIALFALVVGIVFLWLIIRSITSPLRTLMKAVEFIAVADLTQEIKVTSNDEIGDLAASFRDMVSGLRAILAKVQESTSQITSASNEILAASQQQASAAREQSSAVAETTSAAKELSTTSESVGESIKKVAQVAAHAMAGMSKIKESIDKTNGMLNSLGEKSQKIGKITELIDDVADQTNLLAVNASIEAARAGEQGRGFTVVADEIRKLADSTAKSTKDITSLIELIQHEMSNAIMSMETSIQSVDEEARLAQQTTEKSKEIAMSTHQQISGAKQIAEAMMNIDETMKQVAAGAQQSQASVKMLTGLAGELKAATSKFKL
jgi:methyl-accepting chemotaxis protein